MPEEKGLRREIGPKRAHRMPIGLVTYPQNGHSLSECGSHVVVPYNNDMRLAFAYKEVRCTEGFSGVSSGTTGNNWTYDLIFYTDGAFASQQENTK